MDQYNHRSSYELIMDKDTKVTDPVKVNYHKDDAIETIKIKGIEYPVTRYLILLDCTEFDISKEISKADNLRNFENEYMNAFHADKRWYEIIISSCTKTKLMHDIRNKKQVVDLEKGKFDDITDTVTLAMKTAKTRLLTTLVIGSQLENFQSLHTMNIGFKQCSQMELIEAFRTLQLPAVIIGTKNEDKIKAITEAISKSKYYHNFPKYVTINCDVKSNVSSQPINLHETTKGAENRAGAVCKIFGTLMRPHDIYVGIENGIVQGYGYDGTEKYYDIPVAYIIACKDDNVQIATGMGPGIAVPYQDGKLKAYQDEIRKFNYKVTERYSYNLFTRESSCEIACLSALGSLMTWTRNEQVDK